MVTGFRAPFPFAGGKSRAAHLVWQALGNPRVYVEPFAGSLATLLARPDAPAIETVNDRDGLIANVWRAIDRKPLEVARHANHPISEVDLHAWHNTLVRAARDGKLAARLERNPRWCSPELAGRWIWGASQWIGGGWCADRSKPHRGHPAISHASHGVHSNAAHLPRKIPLLSSAGTGVQRRTLPDVCALGGKGVHGALVDLSSLDVWFLALSERLRRVRIVCGDFERVLSESALYCEGSSVAGVFLDPPYSHDKRDPDLYAHDDGTASRRAREWALANGDNPARRIVLAGLEGEHEMPASWRCVAWKGAPGLGRVSGNRHRERLWMSPACLRVGEQQGLFDRVEAS